MLYQWGSSSTSTTTIFLPEEELKQEEADQTPPFFLDQYHHQCLTGTDHEELISNSPSIYHPLHPYYHPQQQVPAPNYLELLCSHPYSRAHLESPMLPTTELPMSKLEEELAYARNDGHRLPVHIGLNLGGRTYFSTLSSPCEVDLGCEFFQRPRFVKQRSENSPRCQAEGCASDLSLSKLYYRRHKVCEFHSKASSVVAAGITQRFCQQCSRFHDLSEFDQEKRSCRKRLAEHNRRRRKPQPPQGQSQTNIPGFYMASRYLSESGGITDSSSVTVAALSPLIALECLRAGQPDASCSSSCLRLSADYRPLDPQL